MARLIAPGTVIGGRYEIGAPLGRGGMARVYRARHLGLAREVAFKVIPVLSDEPAAAERFAREARNAARLDHPGCVRVLDVGTAAGLRYLAMDLLEGNSLRAELERRGRFEVGAAVAVVGQLLDALDHAHRRGVLHRDVKPENVMCTGDRIVLIDFGLSRLEIDAPVTASGACVGSPSYLAPERLLQQRYDGRADLYSAGVLLYELLAGRRPFRGATSMDIARQHITGTPDPLLHYRPELAPALVAVVERAMARDPRDRFAGAAHMRAALEAAARAPAGAGAAAAAAPAAVPEESTYIVAVPEPRAGGLRRLWAQLRFGRWRWRRRALALPTTPTSSA